MLKTVFFHIRLLKMKETTILMTCLKGRGTSVYMRKENYCSKIPKEKVRTFIFK